MAAPRTLPLFDERARPSSWNERTMPGEYAVHGSNLEGSEHSGPVCTIFSSLAEAEAYAQERVAATQDLRCRIYDHQGFVGAPLEEFRGSGYKGDGEVSRRFRRWAGSVLLFGGLLLIAVDWWNEFSLSWPAMLGSRMLLPGIVLLCTEAMIVLLARRKAGRARME